MEGNATAYVNQQVAQRQFTSVERDQENAMDKTQMQKKFTGMLQRAKQASKALNKAEVNQNVEDALTARGEAIGYSLALSDAGVLSDPELDELWNAHGWDRSAG